MAITLLNSSTTGSITSTTAGNLVVVWYTGSASAPTDNKSTTYTVVNATNSTALASIAYVLNCASGITTITPPAGGTILAVGEFTGGTGTFSLDVSQVGNGSNTNLPNGGSFEVTTTTLTPAGNNELLVDVCHCVRSVGNRNFGLNFSPTNFSSLNSGSSTSLYKEAMYWIQTTATATTNNWEIGISSGSLNDTAKWADVGIAFIFTASGGASYLPQLMTMGIG